MGDELTSFTIAMIILIVIGCIVVQVLFLIDEVALVRAMKLKDEDDETPIYLVWLQFIPIVGFVAIFIYLIKINSQYNQYIFENKGVNLKKLEMSYGYIYATSMVMTTFIPLIGIIYFVFWILFWININKITKQLSN